MRENLCLMAPVLPAPGSKSFLIVEHLTSMELRERGEETDAESIIRLSLCETPNGHNPVPVYELLLDECETPCPIEAQSQIRTWAAGFILGACYAGSTIGLIIKPMRVA